MYRSKQDAILKAIGKFEAAPALPGLRLEKLRGHDNLWSIRATGGYRILLSKTSDAEGDLWTLEDAGPHDIYRRAGH
jgi:plasmid maintenance system killer protein